MSHQQRGPGSLTTRPTEQLRASTLTQIFSTLHDITPMASGPVRPETSFLLPSYNRTISALHNLSQEDGEKARSIFLTLHVLFPHHLLPALDLLDHGLVTRLTSTAEHVQSRAEPVTSNPSTGDEAPSKPIPGWEVYYIQSSSAVTIKSNPRHKKPSASATFYEVRLDSWNCTCPAFSVDAFQGLTSLDVDEHDEADDVTTGGGESHKDLDTLFSGDGPPEGTDWRFGGTTILSPSGRAPVCKHILAAVLAKSAPTLFGSGVTERTVTGKELAGWAGGWGDFGYG